MRTIAVTDGIKGLVPCRASGSLKLLYMTHLALGDYLYQGPFLKALALSPKKQPIRAVFKKTLLRVNIYLLIKV